MYDDHMASNTSSDQEQINKALRTLASIASLTLTMKSLQTIYDRTYAKGIRKLR